MISTTELQQKDLHVILENFFTSLVDNDSIDEEGKFTLQYRSEDDVGKWIAGRNESESGLDYVYRQRYNNTPEEPDKIYLYSEDFGWSNIGVLSSQEEIILGLSNWVRRYLDDMDEYTNKLEEAFDNIEEERRDIRDNLDLDDIINAINMYNFDFLRDYISPEGEDAVEFWKLLYSYDSNGDIVENDVSIPYRDETIFFARSVRQYTSGDETKIYSMGLVIGYDDTPDSFFIHRIERDEDLDNSNFDWGIENIRDKMGFDIDYTDLETNKIPTNKRIRLQGNLCAVPYDYDIEKESYFNQIVYELKKYLYELYGKLYVEQLDIDKNRVFGFEDMSIDYNKNEMELEINGSTKEIKNIQNNLNITEQDVRVEQKNRDIGRLSSNLRGNIVEDIHLDKFCNWLFNDCDIDKRKRFFDEENKESEIIRSYVTSRFTAQEISEELREIATSYNKEITRSTIHKLAEKDTEDIFNPTEQCNVIFGNHSVIVGSARLLPSSMFFNSQSDRLSLEKLIVPTDTVVMIGHDEHNARMYTFPQGVYEFRFLEGLDTTFFN